VDTAMKVVFIGSGAIGIPALRELHRTHNVVTVVTQPDKPAGRNLKPRPSPVKEEADALCLPVIQPEKIRSPEALHALGELDADIFVVAAYGQILPQALLDIPPLGCINIHASLLPRHRGASPIHAAILAGDAVSGITIMCVDAGLDTGDILLQKECVVEEDDTAGTLHDKLASLAPEALSAALEAIANGSPVRRKQDATKVTYAGKISKSDGLLPWELSAADLARRVRGLNPWPGAFTLMPDGKILKIHRAVAGDPGKTQRPGEAIPSQPGEIRVACGSGCLSLLEVQVPGGKRMAAADFLRGHPLLPGSRFS